jgi:flavin reductase ActVB
MASFPSGASIVTTRDAAGEWWGFTASSFCSVSLEPPLVLTCLARNAQCFPAFADADRWNIHVLQERHTELAVRFATRGVDKFEGGDFVADLYGVPVLPDASIVLQCSSYTKVEGGDHLVLMGLVEKADTGAEAPFVYFRRRFHTIGSGVGQTAEGAGHSDAERCVVLGSAVFEAGMGWG